MATATQNENRVRLVEVAMLAAPSEDRVDKAAGIIRGVKILGFKSRNGRRYLREAVAKAVPMYEGRGVNIDHRKPNEQISERSMRDNFGELRNVHLREDGLYGDLHYLVSHAEADTVAERAEKFPNQIGMSHDAAGQTLREGNEVVVESIDEVISVDLVLYPATTDGLFESEGFKMPEPEEKDKVVVAEQDVVATPAQGEEEKLFAEQVNGVLNGGGTVDDMKLALTEMCSPEVKEQEGEPDEEEKKVVAVAEQDDEGEKKKEEPDVKESIARLERKVDAQDVLLENRVDRAQLTPPQVELLESQTDKKAMEALVESWPPYLRQPAGQPLAGHVRTRNRKASSYDDLRKELVPKG